jgi:nucleotide-binding universal stress UspA family protein
MRKILVPVDGSKYSLRALDVVLGRRSHEKESEIHLLNVQLPVDSGHARMFVSEEALHDYHQAEGISSLEEAGKILDEAHVSYSQHVLVGHISETIVRFAQEKGFDEIVMGTHGRTGLTHLLLGSIASEIVKKSELPVTLVK